MVRWNHTQPVFHGAEPYDPPIYASQAGGVAKLATVLKENYTPGKTIFLSVGGHDPWQRRGPLHSG